MLNKQCPDKIDWTDWTWNPISGCLHGCDYCYMNRMEKRFPGINKPAFHFDRIDKFLRSKKVKPGEKIFVGSSGDMWGEWVLDEWISAVLDVVELTPEFTYQFLTKNPDGYADWEFFQNCWIGTTVDGTSRTENNLSTLVRSVPKQFIRFVSFEPLIKNPSINESVFQELDWIIIGADSTRGAKKTPNTWAEFIIDMAREFSIPIWVKDNYQYYDVIKEFPKTKAVNP
ncbi:DUF5131 family protein [Desulfotignum balticum]|uniref:DUF5131 family protein n=1 Tax=Desulfotignum balticum TaxID=115781 RepID=UPI000421E880|nr:DUF5131 family protein [Desulfotignum balticum]